MLKLVPNTENNRYELIFLEFELITAIHRRFDEMRNGEKQSQK